MTVLIVVVAIVAAVAMRTLTNSMKQTRKGRTEREIEMLQHAIAGDPSLMSVAGGVRTDFGYVGDVGAFPPDLDALVTNPGGYQTWDGPYIPAGFAEDTDGFKTDEWGQPYTYNGGLDIVSHGSGKTIRRGMGDNEDDFLRNTVYGVVRDVNDSLPGVTWRDSVDLEAIIPDGAGGLDAKVYHPDSVGEFMLDSIPIGKHLIRAIFTPDKDTLVRYMRIMPRHNSDDQLVFNFAANYFSEELGADSMLTLVEGSQLVYGSGMDCNNISFEIRNNTGEDIQVTSLTLTWSTPTAYYQEVWWGPDRVWENGNPRNGSGEVATFSETKTITYGSTALIKVEAFRGTAMGNGSKPDMSGTTFTVLFSDGSTFDVSMGSCN
ncbi:MAG: hypothetical protein JSU74_00845 [Candidatus Zixiibacteriota bacterium]|nr:MAG: hypothetical protein JSU74_00845 [candidate division Zixibacteria bacterium]